MASRDPHISDPPLDRIAIALSPLGHVVLRSAGPDEAVPQASIARRIAAAFDAGGGAGLFHLGASETSTPLPNAFGFWRDFSRRFVAALCGTADLEDRRDQVEVPPPTAALEELARSAPPMAGAEYLSVDVLNSLWGQMREAFAREARGSVGTMQELLARKNPAWSVVGRVHFHLAENRRDPDHPFAFLASYTTGLSAQGTPQHRALGQAVRESSSARDKNRLLALLGPVQKAAQRSGWLKELVDSGRLFQPLAWVPAEAHRFLQEIPTLEESGLLVRVPDWWKARRTPRPQVTVAVGKHAPAGVGIDALLDFSVSVTLDGERLTEKELAAMRASGDGLVLLKGKWVEVDQQKLDEVLARWRTVEAQAEDGMAFIQGMRLLAGAPVDEGVIPEGGREWMGIEAGAWLKDLLGGIRDSKDVDRVPKLRAELRPYQRQGVEWLWLLTQLRLGACLADDMGLGKTIQVLALLLLLKERKAIVGPHLLVVPASLIANWKAEAERFAPSLRLRVAHPSVAAGEALVEVSPESLREVDVVVTSYGQVQRLRGIADQPWGLLVLDEAQAIKNPSTQQARRVKALSSQARIALTGTPVENRLGDLWSIFDFLNPGLLGSAKDFGAFVKRADSYRPLRELVRPYLLRRLKTDRSLLPDLPEKSELRAYCALSKRQLALYQQSVDQLSEQLARVRGIERRGLVLSYLIRFKQICNHPSQWLGDGDYAAEESGKHARLKEICEVIASRQEKVLVFTQFREMTEPLTGWLSGLFGRSGLVLSGETPIKKRQEMVRRFQEDEQIPFFVLSLKAGGTGLNLTAASHVIHFDRWWNPAVETQATDRAFRIGQKKNVLVHKLVCRGTVEERIDTLIESKRGMSTELFEGSDELKMTELGDEELMKLVALDIHSARAES